MLGKIIQGGPCGLLGRCIVDMFHIGGEGLLVLPYHVPTGITNLVHHAYLGLGLREYVLDRIGEPVQVIGGRNKDVLRAFISVSTDIQKAEDSFLPSHRPSTSFFPSLRRPTAM